MLGRIIMLATLAAASAAAAGPAHKADPRKAAALNLVKAQLKDAGSAQFKDVKPLNDKGDYCGRVNAKNSYGGYTGFSVFYATADGKVEILPPDQSGPSLC